MKWLVILAGIGAAALSWQRLMWARRGGRPPSTRSRVALAVLTVLLIGGAVYSAHVLGIFSVPLVAMAFVPVGVTVRWLILATREARQRSAYARAGSAPEVTLRARLMETFALPVFLVLVAAVVVLGLVAGTLVGPH
jgi:hypothetical protein